MIIIVVNKLKKYFKLVIQDICASDGKYFPYNFVVGPPPPPNQILRLILEFHVTNARKGFYTDIELRNIFQIPI